MKYLTLSLLLTALLPALSSQALTLDAALDAALQNHQRIEQFRAAAAQSHAAVGTARAPFLPRLDLSYAYSKSNQDPFSFGKQSSTLALGASLNLFNGLADYRSYQAAKQRATAANYQLQGIIADIILETRQSYIEVLRAESSLTTATEGVRLLERQKRDADLQLKYGVIARNDLLRVEVELSSARQDLLQAEGTLQIGRRQLERMLGHPLADAEKPNEESIGPLLNADWGTAEDYRQQLLEQRSELNYLRHLRQATDLDLKASKGGFLPSVDLAARHEEYGDSLAPNGRDRSFDEDNLLLLSANWNLFNGFASSKAVSAAEASRRSAAALLRDTEARLILQLQTSLQNARIAQGRLLEAQTGVTQAQENYRVSENRFAQQQATTVDLLDAQFLLTRARNLQVNARYDLYLTSAVLQRVLERDRLKPSSGRATNEI